MIARVLVIDDDEYIRRALARSLTHAGFEVTTATGSTPAMELTHLFDLVVCDYNLGSDANGADVVRHFKAQYAGHIYCAVLSGEDDPMTRNECLAAGADDVFVKPASPRELKQRLLAAALELRSVAA
ncbi:MAG: response regulator transcription factor [Deltaproteobacteria bacterium]|nr:response regulator transcription factor [Deltaproteobacteria bacterium]MDQ3298767.1 response regulator [Myxococcota bacterium]